MSLGAFTPPPPRNEPVRDYAPNSPERATLKGRLLAMSKETVEVPLIINGEEVFTGDTQDIVMPHDHGHVLGRFHRAGADQVKAAIDSAEAARHDWMMMPWEERASIFLKAGELLATTWRDTVNASTMLGQSKTAYQAEIDSACELVDFFRFNVAFMTELMAQQPQSAPGMWNRLEHRPLDGFVFAITPFNFTSIAGNLPTAPAMLGNTAIWKPASTSVLSNHYLMQMLMEAGLPPGVINFVPGSGAKVGDPVIADPRLGGVHFTGSTETFQRIWGQIGQNIASYGQYPRIVGETGGKDFVFAHPSADLGTLATALVRGAFEYQGQKCSAASRAYIPKSLWTGLEPLLRAHVDQIAMGDPRDFRNFMAAVIDRSAFSRLEGAITRAHEESSIEVITGGTCDSSTGYFVSPTIARVDDPRDLLMRTEWFGPLLSIFVYEDERLDEALQLCNDTSEYALTGAIFARDRKAVRHAVDTLRFAAGNFYINDKPTGAVVGQQPFGGSRASGTNDKAGSILNLLRWVSPRTIKETWVPPINWRYPSMDAE